MTSPQQFKEVDEGEMRRIFNQNRFWERQQSGELNATTKQDRPAPPTAGQVPGTRSQIIRYFDADGNLVAVIHQYLRPNGTLGGGGKPDPKWLKLGDVVYLLRPASL